MMVTSTMLHGQSPWLFLLAALLCLSGGWATARFFERMTGVQGALRAAWLFLTALVSGVMIWCTHFVAMLGWHADPPPRFDVALTSASLLIAFVGSAAGLHVGGKGKPGRLLAPVLGGVIVGLAISAMHYVGMSGMHLPPEAVWDAGRVYLSVVVGVLLAVGALCVARSSLPNRVNLMWLLLSGAVLLMHVTGMGALMLTDATGDMQGMPGLEPGALQLHGAPPPAEQSLILAGAIVGLSFLTISVGVVGYLIDRSRAQADERLRHLALYDELTGLPNRTSLNARIAEATAQSGQTGPQEGGFALVVIDVDDFKGINDRLGHPVGDEVLRTLGARMTAHTQADPEWHIARIGGDEFVALCPAADKDALPARLELLQERLSAPMTLGGQQLTPRLSLGAAVYPVDAVDADALVNNADLAMYRAKGDPLLGICLYEAAIDEQTRQRRGLAVELRDASARGELTLHYQPQISVTTGETIGYEALLRWYHPQLGPVSPAEFIPLAESSGQILPIGAWVLRRACTEAAHWDPPLRVSVNVSAVQLADEGFVRMVQETLCSTGLPAHRLELEMTETAVFGDPEHALATLQAVKQLGIGLAIDDFGVGYSSLSALRSFPFDRIKIDRSFFSDSGAPEQTVELVQTVLSLGRTFGMSVLAEGIETAAQLAMLMDAGCPEAQGYLFGRPAPLADLLSAGRLTIRSSTLLIRAAS